MATLVTTMISPLFLLILLVSTTTASPPTTTTPYLSPTTLFTNYKTMLKNFKIFIYPLTPPPRMIPSNTTTTQPPITSLSSLFHNSLLSTPFLTQNPQKAHLFFIPFPPHYSTRFLTRLISNHRSTYPYWDRTLGADHFFVCSPHDIGPSSSRNVVELKKNAIRISPFPSLPGHFIPHKDISFPPLYLADSHAPPLLPSENKNKSSSVLSRTKYLGYLRWDEKMQQAESSLLNLINQLKNDPNNFLIETESSSDSYNNNIDILKRSSFCLFVYGFDQSMMTGLGEAMLHGCVPVFITSDDRPIQDLPFMDVLKWHDLALFVGTRVGIKDLLLGFKEEEEYEKMRRLGVIASKHFIWNINAKPLDAFYMMMYQLWNRRFVIRYARY